MLGRRSPIFAIAFVYVVLTTIAVRAQDIDDELEGLDDLDGGGASAKTDYFEPRQFKGFLSTEGRFFVADRDATFMISGQGDVIEPSDGVCAIGSGGAYALAAARALVRHTEMSAREVCAAGMQVAGEICVFTNTQISVLEVGGG